jgi:hypothetical protein
MVMRSVIAGADDLAARGPPKHDPARDAHRVAEALRRHRTTRTDGVAGLTGAARSRTVPSAANYRDRGTCNWSRPRLAR